MHTWRWMISLPAAFWIKFSPLPWSFPDWMTRFCMCYGTVLQVKNPKRRFPKGSSGSGRILVGHLPPHNVQPPPASVILPLQVLLCQQLSFSSSDFSVNLLRGSFQKTFIHDVYTSYSHIICAYFIFMYLYLRKNASVHIFCHHGIVIFLWAAPPPLLALLSHCTQHSRRTSFQQQGSVELPSQPNDPGGLATCLHIGPSTPDSKASESTHLPSGHYCENRFWRAMKLSKSKHRYAENSRSWQMSLDFHKNTQKFTLQKFPWFYSPVS